MAAAAATTAVRARMRVVMASPLDRDDQFGSLAPSADVIRDISPPQLFVGVCAQDVA
jgi:hypothetical protein